MLDPARSTANMPLQARTHHSPTQPRPIAHRIIGLGNTQDTLLNQIQDLAIESRLKPVCNMAGKFLPQVDRLLADRRIKRHRLLDGFGRCFRPTDDFYQRDDVRRIEGVTNDAAFRMLTFGLQHAHRQPRRTRGDERVGRSCRIHISE